MSEASPFPAERIDVLPGYTLIEPPMADFTAMETILDRNFAAERIAAATMVGPEAVRQAHDYITEHLEKMPHRWPRRGFALGIQKDQMLGTLLYFCLRAKYPAITGERASALITDKNRASVREALFDLWRLEFEKPAKKAEEAPVPPAASSTSPNSSAPPESPQPISQG